MTTATRNIVRDANAAYEAAVAIRSRGMNDGGYDSQLLWQSDVIHVFTQIDQAIRQLTDARRLIPAVWNVDSVLPITLEEWRVLAVGQGHSDSEPHVLDAIATSLTSIREQLAALDGKCDCEAMGGILASLNKIEQLAAATPAS